MMMMKAWLLVVHLGCSGWGCGSTNYIPYPTKQDCYEALREMKLNQQGQLAEQNGNQSAAWCEPSKEALTLSKDESK